jgi:hypothetical protein
MKYQYPILVSLVLNKAPPYVRRRRRRMRGDAGSSWAIKSAARQDELVRSPVARFLAEYSTAHRTDPNGVGAIRSAISCGSAGTRAHPVEAILVRRRPGQPPSTGKETTTAVAREESADRRCLSLNPRCDFLW